jgi:hypothetical protein
MLPPLQHRFDGIEARRHALLTDLRALPVEQLGFHPAPKAWSLGEVAQHLTLVETKVTRALTERRVTGVTRRPLGDVLLRGPLLDFGLSVGWRARMPVRGVAPDPSVTLDDTAQRWAATRAALAEYLGALDEAACRVLVYRHPIGGHMDILGTLEFLARHHDHHLRQVARIRRAPGYPATRPAAAGTA